MKLAGGGSQRIVSQKRCFCVTQVANSKSFSNSLIKYRLVVYLVQKRLYFWDKYEVGLLKSGIYRILPFLGCSSSILKSFFQIRRHINFYHSCLKCTLNDKALTLQTKSS